MYARIVEGIVAEIIPATAEPIEDRFHPDVLATLVLLEPEQVGVVDLGWLYDGEDFIAPAPPPAASPLRFIRPNKLRARIPIGRRRTLTQAAASDNILRTWLDDLGSALYINLDDAELVSYTAQLVTEGKLLSEDRDAILADVTPEEAV